MSKYVHLTQNHIFRVTLIGCKIWQKMQLNHLLWCIRWKRSDILTGNIYYVSIQIYIFVWYVLWRGTFLFFIHMYSTVLIISDERTMTVNVVTRLYLIWDVKDTIFLVPYWVENIQAVVMVVDLKHCKSHHS